MGAPQSVPVGVAITLELEIIFYLVEKSRKFANIACGPRVAFLIGCQLRPNPRPEMVEFVFCSVRFQNYFWYL
jgi:hypothetical protein